MEVDWYALCVCVCVCVCVCLCLCLCLCLCVCVCVSVCLWLCLRVIATCGRFARPRLRVCECTEGIHSSILRSICVPIGVSGGRLAP